MILALWFGVFCLVSCAPQTPQTRIEHQPELFATLKNREQEAARAGALVKGMSQTGVFFAIGKPSQVYQVWKNGKMSERWVYESLREHEVNRFSTRIGFGYGAWGGGRFGRRYDPFYDSYYGFDYGPDVIYTRERMADLWFEKNRLQSWELRR